MADNTSVTSPYPYLRKVSSLPEVMSPSSINLADTLILVQTNTTKRTSVDTLIRKITDLIDAPDAFKLAKRHGYIDENATIEEWFEYLRGGGVSQDELKLVVGKYQIVKGVMGTDANNQLEFIRDDSEGSTLEDDAFIIYQDKTTLKCYTKQPESNAYYEWDGMLDAFTFISEVVGNKENTPTYKANMRTTDNFPKRVVNGTEVDDPYQVTTFAGLRVYEHRDPKLGELIRLSYTDDPYGHMVFYDGTKFVDYTGVIDYIQVVTNNVFRITAGAATKLADPRDITVATGLEEDNLSDITAATFDGSADATITINKLNADVLAGSGDFTAARSITAEKIKDPIDITLTGAVNETIENVDMSRDITVNISAVNAQYITGALDPNNATAGKLTTARDIGMASSIVGDTITNITAASFDGTEDVELTINAINGELISGAVANAESAIHANTASSAATAANANEAALANEATHANNASTSDKLTTARNIGISTGINDDTDTSITPAEFDGHENANITINKLNARILSGTIPADVNIIGTVNTIRVVNQSNKMYLLGSSVGANDASELSPSGNATVQRSVKTTKNVIGEDTEKWVEKTWNGLARFFGVFVWIDGENIYYSYNGFNYVLDKSTSTWTTKTWNGLTDFDGTDVWTDGENIYYSYNGANYVLDKSTSTWTEKTWNGLTSFGGEYIWTDGENIYYSNGTTQYVLDKSTSTWTEKTWNGLTDFNGEYIWTDGENIYYSSSTDQFVLNKSTSTWTEKTWNGLTNFYGEHVWTDGENIYCSYISTQYVLDKSTSTWSTKTWNGLTPTYGYDVWTDGENIYYSQDTAHYVLNKPIISWTTQTNATIDTEGNLTVNSLRTTSDLTVDNYLIAKKAKITGTTTENPDFYVRNIGYGTSSAPPNTYTANNGDLWVYY